MSSLHLAEVTVAATRAESAQVWLLDGERLVLAAAVPSQDADADADAADAGRKSASLAGADRSVETLTRAVDAAHGWPIHFQDELLGLLVVGVPSGTTLGSADHQVAADIAGHAGLLVHNARLVVTLARQVAELATRAEELHATRRALVTAQDAERRRLERDLHDGAQQALVASVISVRAGLAHPPVTRAEVEEVREMLGIAQESVDDLCGDGRPEVLTNLGLRGALDRSVQLARHTGLAVDLDVDLGPDVTLRPEVESAVYFCCVECLQNVTKYAAATRAVVSVTSTGQEVSFAVVDDGTGFTGQDEDRAGGLRQLSERLAVLGGMLTVAAGPDRGVAVRGRVPTGQDSLVSA